MLQHRIVSFPKPQQKPSDEEEEEKEKPAQQHQDATNDEEETPKPSPTPSSPSRCTERIESRLPAEYVNSSVRVRCTLTSVASGSSGFLCVCIDIAAAEIPGIFERFISKRWTKDADTQQAQDAINGD